MIHRPLKRERLKCHPWRRDQRLKQGLRAPQGLGAKHWIVESDTLSTTAPRAQTTPTVPISGPAQPDGAQRGFRYLGAWEVFDGRWSEPATTNANSIKTLSGNDLHAVSTGDIAFAAFYPNARGVLVWHTLQRSAARRPRARAASDATGLDLRVHRGATAHHVAAPG